MDLQSPADRDRLLRLLGVVERGTRTLLDNVFVLGVNEPQKTVYAQQCRALNLVEALVLGGRLKSGTSVAVVGGGIGGATVAAAAAIRGARVTILERHSRLMALQAGSHTRWLHPHAIEWPAPGWHEDDAALPVMSWRAAPASDVVATLTKQWRRLVDAFAINEVVNVDRLDFVAGATAHELTWDGDGWGTMKAEIVIFAVGHGSEASGRNKPSYWHDDAVDAAPHDTGSTLVSGCGDGGLIDIFRAAVAYGSWQDVFDVLQEPSMKPVEEAVAAAEGGKCDTDQELSDFYIHLDAGPLDAFVAANRRHADVTLNSATSMPFARGRAAPLNKLLASRVLRLNGHYASGRVSTVEITSDGGDGSFVVTFEGRSSQVFDLVVLRHGPTSNPLDEFPTIDAFAGRDVLQDFADFLDGSRQPMWNDDLMRWPPDDDPPPGPAGRPVRGPSPWTGPPKSHESHESHDSDLRQFLHGGDPSWAVVDSGFVVERAIVGDLVAEISERLRLGHQPAMTWLTGPAGEGKSTVLLQVVRHVAQLHPALTVLWRARPDRRLPIDAIREVPPNVPVLIVSDDAHDLFPHLSGLMRRSSFRRLMEERTAPVHILLAMNDSVTRESPWESRRFKSLLPVRRHRIGPVSWEDASGIVATLEQASVANHDVLGVMQSIPSHKDRVARLVAAGSEGSDSSSLLGALLECRTGRTLSDHVARLLDQLDAETTRVGYSLSEIYLHVAALQIAGLGATDWTLLSGALDVSLSDLREVLTPMIGSDIVVSSTGCRVRHDAIATAVWHVSRKSERHYTALAAAYEGLVASAARLFPEGWRNPRMRDVQYLALALREIDPTLAIAAARGAAAGAPRNLFFLTTLASVLREASFGRQGAIEGAGLLQEAYRRIDEMDPSTLSNVRAMLREWAACVGYSDDNVAAAAGNYCLAAISLSDLISSSPVESAEPTRGLRSIGRALMDLRERWDRSGATASITAVVVLISAMEGDGPTDNFVARYKSIVRHEHRPTIAEAITVLERFYEQAWTASAVELRMALSEFTPPISLASLGSFVLGRSTEGT